MGLKSEVDILYNALFNSPNVQLTRYPANAVGATVTEGGAAAWAYKAAGAAQVQLVALGVNTAGMWICGGGLTIPSVTSVDYVLWLGRGTIPAAVRVAELQFRGIVSAGAAAAVIVAMVPGNIMLPFPLLVRAGVGIAADVATSGNAAETAQASVIVATGLGQGA